MYDANCTLNLNKGKTRNIGTYVGNSVEHCNTKFIKIQGEYMYRLGARKMINI